ncbi:MAG: hypothetical protein NXI32_04970 [bacterium]|nr:hypothetical protein [bacterium]
MTFKQDILNSIDSALMAKLHQIREQLDGYTDCELQEHYEAVQTLNTLAYWVSLSKEETGPRTDVIRVLSELRSLPHELVGDMPYEMMIVNWDRYTG